MSWVNASLECAELAINSELASIRSYEENEFVKGNANKIY